MLSEVSQSSTSHTNFWQLAKKRVFKSQKKKMKMADKENNKKPVEVEGRTHFFEYLLYKTFLRKKTIIFVYNILTSFIDKLEKLVEGPFKYDSHYIHKLIVLKKYLQINQLLELGG